MTTVSTEDKTKSPAKPAAPKPAAQKSAAPKPAAPKPAAPVKIESDVPVPTSGAGRKSAFDPERLPFAKLDVGQSFFVPVDSKGKTAEGITPKTVAQTAKKLNPEKSFVMREVNEGGKKGVRFWRKK